MKTINETAYSHSVRFLSSGIALEAFNNIIKDIWLLIETVCHHITEYLKCAEWAPNLIIWHLANENGVASTNAGVLI